MARALRSLLALLAVTLFAVAAYGAWYIATPVSVRSLPAAFEIPQGTGFRGAALLIEESGVGVGRVQFELLARLLGRAQDIKAGSYELADPPTPLALLDKLTRGDVTQAEIRLIEGWTFRQIRAALDAHAFLRHETQGLDVAQLLERVGAAERHPEGLFFPDTYLFSKGASDVQVLRRAYLAGRRHLAHEWEMRDARVPYRNPYEALIMASIIERETGRAAERDLIGGVLVNRLRIGMMLQADPTVIYGLGDAFDGNLKKAHLLTDGPYNTYTRAGLPPTPIAAVGIASLRAALRPTVTDAIYYVARGDGSSQFSRTLEEHNRAVRKYQLHGAR